MSGFASLYPTYSEFMTNPALFPRPLARFPNRATLPKLIFIVKSIITRTLARLGNLASGDGVGLLLIEM